MSNVPADLRYSKTHEWVLVGADHVATIGITDYAQAALGDVVFVEAPKAGATLSAGQPFGTVESVKAASELVAPLSGVVLESNPQVVDDPALLNSSAYGDGWIMKITLSDPSQLDGLLSADAYSQLIA